MIPWKRCLIECRINQYIQTTSWSHDHRPTADLYELKTHLYLYTYIFNPRGMNVLFVLDNGIELQLRKKTKKKILFRILYVHMLETILLPLHCLQFLIHIFYDS